MHREHSTYSNPTCALRAPFASHTFHSCFHLCRAREKNTRPPNEHSVDNPNVFDGTTNTNAMRECEVTQTYLRDGLLNCSVV